MQIVRDPSEDQPDPRPASFRQVEALPVRAITFVGQATVEDGLPGVHPADDPRDQHNLSVSFTYTLIRDPHGRTAPENLAELDEDMQRMLEELPLRQRPAWVRELSERARYPQLRDAVRTTAAAS